MGHVFAKEFSAVQGLRPSRFITFRSPSELVSVAAEVLHAVMAQYRRNRRWFLTDRDGVVDDVSLWTLWGGVCGSGTPVPLSCTIRARVWKGLPGGIDINFYQAYPKGSFPVGLENADKLTLSVRVYLAKDWRRRRWRLGPPKETLTRLPRRHWHVFVKGWSAGMRQAVKGEPEEYGAIWWIDPSKTPQGATCFVLLLYLWQAGMIRLEPDGEEWAFIKAFVRGPRGYSIDDTALYEILELCRRHFALPQHWKGLRVYLGRVIRDVQRKEHGRADGIANRSGLSRRTLYRLISQKKVPQVSLGALAGKIREKKEISQRERVFLETIDRRGSQRRLRHEATELLEGKGKSRAAARKMIQRHLTAGMSLETIVGRLSRGRQL